MQFPLKTINGRIHDANGDELFSAYEHPIAGAAERAERLVALANLGHHVLKEACHAFPPSAVVEVPREHLAMAFGAPVDGWKPQNEWTPIQTCDKDGRVVRQEVVPGNVILNPQ